MCIHVTHCICVKQSLDQLISDLIPSIIFEAYSLEVAVRRRPHLAILTGPSGMSVLGTILP
jgi:hypothetical protein